MYKLLLCWRYLRTRYLALVCVISVMLGVATLIVVNSVMAGFSTKLRDRLHGILADVSIEAYEFEGFADPEGKMRAIANSPAGQYIAAMTPVIETVGMMQYEYRGAKITKMIKLIGVDPEGRAKVGGFGDYLYDQENHPLPPSFALTDAAKTRLNMFRIPEAPSLPAMDLPKDGETPPP